MNIEGYAFKSNSDAISKSRRARYKELIAMEPRLVKITDKNPAYARTHFAGEFLTEEGKNLSDLDLLLIADDGDTCFGGYVNRANGCFSGAYYTYYTD